MPPPLPDEPSIAVHPFANIRGDPKEDYLSDGITENIITALSKIPRMLVIARNSVFTYKGKPVMVQQVSEELGVLYVLEGSVQKSGDKLRITAQLVDAKTGNHLWSELYDRDLKGLFELQDDITKNVITALQFELTEGEAASYLSRGTKNLEAYLKVMKGNHHLSCGNKNANEISRKLFEEAISLDPNYANAYTLLARTYFRESYRKWTKTPTKSIEKSVEAAKKALSFDEQNAGAYMVLANVYVKRRQFEKSMAAAKKGLSFDPANSFINGQYGDNLYKLGMFKAAIPFLKKALRMDPMHPGSRPMQVGWSYFRINQYEKAIAVFKKSLNREPKNAFAHTSLGVALIGAGKPEEAVEMFEKALSLSPQPPSWLSGCLAVALTGTGQPEKAISMLRELLRSDPDDSWLLFYLSMVLSFEGKYEEALSLDKKALSLGVEHFGHHYYLWLGIPYFMMGEYEEAITAIKKATGRWPEWPAGHIGLAASYSLAGRMEEARAQAVEVLKINPKITLEDIAKSGYNNFQKADKERYINALRKAGLK